MRNKVVLAPIGNNSHSALLESIGLEDTIYNAATKFVRAELVPVDGNVESDPKEWRYIVDQDIVPDWYGQDSERYEQEFRDAVKDWVSKNFNVMCGKVWTKLKEDNLGTYYILFDTIGNSQFGSKNNYAGSIVRNYINSNDLVKELTNTHGQARGVV